MSKILNYESKKENLTFISPPPQFFNISSGLTVAKNGETKLARKWRDIVEILSIAVIFSYRLRQRKKVQNHRH